MGRLTKRAIANRQNGSLGGHHHAQKENLAPMSSTGVRRANALSGQLSEARERIALQEQQINRLSVDRATFQRTANRWKAEARTARATVPTLDPTIATALEKASDAADRYRRRLDLLRKDLDRVQHENKRLRARQDAEVARRVRDAVRPAKQLRLKEKGVIPPNVRALIRDLYCTAHVPMHNCFLAVQLISKTFGLELVGSFSRTAVATCVKEAGIAAKLQIMATILTSRGESSTLHSSAAPYAVARRNLAHVRRHVRP